MRSQGVVVVRYWLAAACALLTVFACGSSDRAASKSSAASVMDAASPVVPGGDDRPVLLFLGTSLTAGYGLAVEEAFPALIQQRIDREELGYQVVNAGVSGDTSAGGLRRIDWLLRLPIAVLVLELGANDMLRGLDVAALRENLQSIIDRTRTSYPDVQIVVAGMRAAPNLGSAYARDFDAVFPSLARDNGAARIPFLLEGVAGNPRLNQPDGLHPTAAGHERLADNVFAVLEPLLENAGRSQ